jgi:hypothetical protein
MKKLLVIPALFGLVCIPAFSQDVPKAEVYGGYQLLYDVGASEYGANGSAYHGFTAAFEGNIRPSFGIVGEFGFNRHTEESGITDSWRNLSFLFGPRFSYRNGNLRVFGHFLIGAVHFSMGESAVYDDTVRSSTSLGHVIGGGFDVAINKRISLRPAQIELFSVNSSEDRFTTWSQHLRYSGGVVFKFGSR